MGDFVCFMKKSRIESGGDSGKIVMMNPPRGGGLKSSRDYKGDGHCRHSVGWRQKLGVTPLHSSIIRRSFRA